MSTDQRKYSPQETIQVSILPITQQIASFLLLVQQTVGSNTFTTGFAYVIVQRRK